MGRPGEVPYRVDALARAALAPVAADDPTVLMNDGAHDPAGRFLAGTMSRGAEPVR